MKKLKFIFERTLTFENNVGMHYFSLRCIPHHTKMQEVHEINFEMSPYASLAKSKDCFGNHLYTGCIKRPHNHFYFHVDGIVSVKGEPLVDENLVGLFKYPSSYTQIAGDLTSYYNGLKIPKFYNDLEKAVFLMEELNDEMYYETQCTDIHTTAAQAFEIKKGVCQDYAHIFLALCRAEKIPARYVAGFILGEGETHAWVEVYSEGLWYGLDPTHNSSIDDTYIKLAIGRDYGDCNIDKGLFYGNTTQKQEIMVKVETCDD
nr:transglutaminase family protein [uncultured Cellulosilyticum sp.]